MRTLQHNKGYALAFSLIFLLMVVTLVAAYVLITAHGLTTASRAADVKRAYYVADAGITDAFMQLRGYSSPASSFTVANASYAMGNGKTGSYSVTAVSNGASFATYTLTSTGTYNGASKTLILTVKQSSISTYAYLTNSEVSPTYGNLWWTTGTTAQGPTRTNGTFNISGNPIFNGSVTQSGAAIHYSSSSTNNPSFNDGLTVGAATVPIPTTTLLTNISTGASSASGLLLTGATTIVFNSDGTMSVTNTAKGWTNKSTAIPSNGMVYVQNTGSSSDGNVTVKGTIKGQVTLGAANQVSVNGSLIYNTDPRTNSASTDLLGLVSKNKITILTASTPANAEMDAVFVALNGALQVDNPSVTGKSNMVQFGSVVQAYAGPTGSFNPSTGLLTGGWNLLQAYDTRLQTMTPPGFLAAADSTGRTIYTKISFKEQ